MAELEYLLTFADIPFCSDEGDDGLFLDLLDPDMREATDVYAKRQHPEPRLLDEVNRVLPLQYLQDYTPPLTYPGRKLGALAKQWQETCLPATTIRVGDWYYPNNACRWSVFRGLATSLMVKAMLAATGGNTAAQFTMRNVPSSPHPFADANYTLESFLYMLPPRPLGELGGTFDGLYLVTLVDERFYWQNNPVSLKVTKDSTWASLIQQLATVLSVTISVDSISAAYGKPEPDSQLWTNMENAAVLLDAIAFNIGRVVVRNLTGTYSLLSPTESQTLVTSNRGNPVTRLAGGNMFAPATEGLPVGDLRAARNAVVPATLTVTFPKYVQGDDPVPHFLNSRYANQRPSNWFEESYGDTWNVQVPVTSGGVLVSGLAGTGGQSIHTTAKALYETEAAASGNPLNVSGLTALALQAAQDYYGAQAAAALDEVYPGTYHWQPEGIHDIVWTWSERSRLASTRVMRSPWNQVVSEFQHSAPAMSGQTNVTRGVGGPSVAQTWRDNPLLLSGQISTTLSDPLTSGGITAAFTAVDNFPTQNRWKGRVDSEDILFEGTSGGTSVGIVFRGIDGTIQTSHAGGAAVTQLLPNTAYGVNLVTAEKMQWLFPGAHTSGGVQEVVVVPQTQTVYIQSASGMNLGGVIHYSGAVLSYDTVNGLYTGHETVWVRERNDDPVISGKRYDGQFAGFSLTGQVSPVYLINAAGSGLAGGGGGVMSGTIQWFHFVACGLSGINCSGFIFEQHIASGQITTHLFGSGVFQHRLLDPPYHIDTVSGTPTKGSIIVGNSGTKWEEFPVGVSGTVLQPDPTSIFGVKWGNIVTTSGSTNPHNLLDPTIHTDTVSGTPIKGTFIIGNSGGKWQVYERGDEDTIPISRSGNNQGIVWEKITADNIASGTIESFNLGSGVVINQGRGSDWHSFYQAGSGRRGETWYAGGSPSVDATSVDHTLASGTVTAVPFLVTTDVTVAKAGIKAGAGNLVSGTMRLGIYHNSDFDDLNPTALRAAMSGPLNTGNLSNVFKEGNLPVTLTAGMYWLLLFADAVPPNSTIFGWNKVAGAFYLNRWAGYNPTISGAANLPQKYIFGRRPYPYPGDTAALPDPAPDFFYLSGHWDSVDQTEIPGIFLYLI